VAVVLPLRPTPAAPGCGGGPHGAAVQGVDLLPGLGDAVVVYLGNGCSVTAVDSGIPRHTTLALRDPSTPTTTGRSPGTGGAVAGCGVTASARRPAERSR
jgi:hypothetical protein